jgi:3-phosphoshikimate 1-carboxyvinyltransferase
MREDPSNVAAQAESKLYIAPTSLIRGDPELPSSKYYTLRYLLAATLAEGESKVSFPAVSDDTDALFRGCRALGAELTWLDERQQVVLADRLSEARTQFVGGLDKEEVS